MLKFKIQIEFFRWVHIAFTSVRAALRLCVEFSQRIFSIFILFVLLCTFVLVKFTVYFFVLFCFHSHGRRSRECVCVCMRSDLNLTVSKIDLHSIFYIYFSCLQFKFTYKWCELSFLFSLLFAGFCSVLFSPVRLLLWSFDSKSTDKMKGNSKQSVLNQATDVNVLSAKVYYVMELCVSENISWAFPFFLSKNRGDLQVFLSFFLLFFVSAELWISD